MKAQKWISVIIAVLLCLQTNSFAASGSVKKGSVTIRVETLEDDVPVPAYKLHFCSVADSNGYLDDDFENTHILPSAMLDNHANTENAGILHAYAKANGISGNTATTDAAGEVSFSDLEAGIYMVWPGEDNELIFLPYLVYVPTIINAEEIWNILSTPKVGDKPGTPPSPQPPGPTPGTDPAPVPPPGTGEPDEPQLPQTGINRLPAQLFLAFGLAFTALGLVIIVRDKGKVDDE